MTLVYIQLQMSTVEQYKSKAEKGDTDAMFNYANILRSGNGVAIDKKKASEYYLKAVIKDIQNPCIVTIKCLN